MGDQEAPIFIKKDFTNSPLSLGSEKNNNKEGGNILAKKSRNYIYMGDSEDSVSFKNL